MLAAPALAHADDAFEVDAMPAATVDAPAGKLVWHRGDVQLREADDVFTVEIRDGDRWYSPGPLDNLADGFVGMGACDDVARTGTSARSSGGTLWVTLSFRCRRHGHAHYAVVYACRPGKCARIRAGDADEGGSARIEGDHAVVRWGNVTRPVTVTF